MILSVTKDKNLLTIITATKTKQYNYILDINTGSLLNTKTGNTVGRPIGLKFDPTWPISTKTVWNIRQIYNILTCIDKDDVRKEALQGLELLENLGFTPEDIYKYGSITTYRTAYNLKRYIHKFMLHFPKNEDETLEHYIEVRCYNYALYKTIQASGNKWAKSLTEEEVANIYNNVPYSYKNCNISSVLLETFNVVAYYCHNEKMRFLIQMLDDKFSFMRYVFSYVETCLKLGKTPQKVADFPREYVETMNAWRIINQAKKDAAIQGQIAQHSTAFDFSDNNFIVVTPGTTKDLVDEGRNMHNCVAGYVGDMIDGITNIVFIRKKTKPDKSYITCEVRNNGRIGQYYLSCNTEISSEEDIAFRNAFQNHLNKTWNERN